jgi:amino acid transporter
MSSLPKVHPHDVGLPETAVRRRRRSRRLATIMLAIALIIAAGGWFLFVMSMLSAMRVKDQPPSLVIVAYALLIVSSITLVLGFWYMLRAQMERLSRMVDVADLEEPGAPGAASPRCQRQAGAGDRFCRQCGTALAQNP